MARQAGGTGSRGGKAARRREPGGWRGLCWGVALGALLLALPGATVRAQSPAAFTVQAVHPPFRVIDGDTFETDLNGDGRVRVPQERIRLLYVDTPELSPSSKGTDPVRGEAARRFLAAALEQGPVSLRIPEDKPQGKYGRTLAIVLAGGKSVNLELVRAGWSYFDTRFTFPDNYDDYANAEGEAFSARRGIWSDSESRERYLRRLKREWKTPRSAENPLYGGAFTAETFDWRKSEGKYVRVQGRMVVVNGLRPQSVRIRLETPPGHEPVRGVLFYPMTERLRMTRWSPGSQVVLEGFVGGYRNQPTIIIHYAATASAEAWRAPPDHLVRQSPAPPIALQFGAPLAIMNARPGGGGPGFAAPEGAAAAARELLTRMR